MISSFRIALNNKVLAAIGLITLLLLIPLSLQAQVNAAAIVGTVTDPSGAVVPNATVTIKNVNTGIARTAPTNTTGEYLFTYLQVGTYQVTVEASGFRTFVVKNMTISAGDRARVDAALQVGAADEVVSVSAESAPALDTDHSTIGSLIPDQILKDMPLNGRNITDLVRLVPGVNQGAQAGMVVGYGVRTEDSRPYSAYVANGQQSDSNNNMIDGGDNNEALYGIVGVRPSLDAIQEVKVQTNLYSAEVGRTAGGVIDVITKSGTNGFHGSAYEFLRNDVFDSRLLPEEVQPEKSELRQNQFGASLGGPIKKDKTFFFADYEGFRKVEGQKVTALVPDALQRTGDFSELSDNDICTGATGGPPGPPGPGGGPANCLLSILRSQGINSLADAGITHFDPIAEKLISLYPMPNVNTTWAEARAAGYNYVAQPKLTQYSTTLDGRIDHHFSQSDSLSGHYTFNDYETTTPTIYPGVTIDSTTYFGGAGQVAKQRVQRFTLDELHMFRPNLLLDLKASYMRYQNNVLMINPENAATDLGFPCDAISCINSTIGEANYGLPIIQDGSTIAFGTGASGGGGSGINLGDNNSIPFHTSNNTYQFSGALTWTRGSHAVRSGASLIRRQAFYMQSGNGTLGLITVDGSATGNYLTDLLIGTGAQIARGTENVAQNLRNWESSIYVQDDWRATPWLTLNLGLRWELITPWTDINGYMANFDMTSQLLVSPYMNGANHIGDTIGIKAEYHDFAPRVGFSASLKHDMVVRGGFGMTYFIQPSTGSQGYLPPFQNNLGCGNAKTGSMAGAPCTDANGYGYFTFTNTNEFAGLAALPGLGYTQVAMGIMAPLDLPTETALIQAGRENYPGMILPISMDNVTPYLMQWSLQVQKQFGANVFTLGYVGNAGRHLHVGMNVNQHTTMADWVAAGGKGYLPLMPVRTHLQTNMTIGNSSYHALQAQFNRRYAKGITTNVSYTWAHNMALGLLQQMGPPSGVSCPRYGCQQDNPWDPFSPIIIDQNYDYGNSELDLRHRISIMASYELPFAKSQKGVLGAIAKGWSVAGNGFWQTGNPYSVNSNLMFPFNAGPGGGMRASVIADPLKAGDVTLPNGTTCVGPSALNTPVDYNGYPGSVWAYNPCAFVNPSGPYFGAQMRNQLFNPHAWSINGAMSKDFAITENYKLQFRAEGFNLTNTTNDAAPSTATVGSSQNGMVTRTGSTGRQFQFGLRFIF